MKKMNLPNKLTVLRILLVPAVIAAILNPFPFHFAVAGVLFGIAAITDALDGRIARRDNLITDFGKFADPLADKILVISVLVCFVKVGLCGAIPLIVIIFREFAVTSVRLVAAAKGKVISANIWGKIKTVMQMISVFAVFAFQTIIDCMAVSATGKVISIEVFTHGAISAMNNPAYQSISGVYDIFWIIGHVLLWLVAVITVISGVKYLIDNKEVISDM